MKPPPGKNAAKPPKATPTPAAAQGGRPRVYDRPMGRLNLALPIPLVEAVVLRARREKKTPGQLVAELLGSLLQP